MPQSEPAILSTRNLGVAVPGRSLVEALDMTLRSHEFVAVLGQNGAGKSLTLHTLCGLRSPATGEVRLNDERITSLQRSDIARRLALLPQDSEDVFPATVMDTVLIGRHPHIGRFAWESDDDRQIARTALDAVGLAGLSSRDVLTLSGGERRRLAIAQVLAQAPQAFILDEPTNHLDPQHQLETLALFRAAANNGASVIASLHDVNLASRFADRCLLLYGDGRWILGDTATVLTTDTMSDLFNIAMESVPWRSGSLFVASGDPVQYPG